jgi:hypothetical protein
MRPRRLAMLLGGIGLLGSLPVTALEPAGLEDFRATVFARIPAGHAVGIGELLTVAGTSYRAYLIEDVPVLTGADIQDATARIEKDFYQPTVAIQFNERGARALQEATRAALGRRLAIVIDGLVRSTPIVMSAIDDGRAVIALGGNLPYERGLAEAQALADRLRQHTGSLALFQIDDGAAREVFAKLAAPLAEGLSLAKEQITDPRHNPVAIPYLIGAGPEGRARLLDYLWNVKAATALLEGQKVEPATVTEVRALLLAGRAREAIEKVTGLARPAESSAKPPDL